MKSKKLIEIENKLNVFNDSSIKWWEYLILIILATLSILFGLYK